MTEPAKKATEKKESSKQVEKKPPVADTLLSCLNYIIKYYRFSFSEQTLLSGLPLKNGKLSPFLFVRAALRASLNAQVIERSAKNIKPETLPAVALLDGDRGVILKEKTSSGVITIFDPQTDKDKIYSSIEEFNEDYSGMLILVKPVMDQELQEDSFSGGQEWFWGVLRQFKRLYIQVGLAAIFINFTAIVSPLFIMNVYDRVVPNAAFETLWVLALGVFIAYSFDFIFRQLRGYFIDVAGRGADILLAGRLFQQVLNVRLGLHGTSSGGFANQLREFETLRDFFTSATLVTLIDLPFVFLFVGFIAILGGPLFAIPLVFGAIALVVSLAIQRPLREIIQQAVNDMDMKHGHLVETINSLETIKALGAQSKMQSKWEKVVGVVARVGLKTRFIASLGTNFTMYMQHLVSVAVVIGGVYLISEGRMTMGALIACTILAGRAMAPLSQAIALYTRYHQAKASLDTLNHIMNLEVERPAGKNYVRLPKFQGGITFKEVGFAYPNAPLDSLKNINLHIKPGERVGIIGRTGSGKSTVARLILNLYNPVSGSILLDGLEVRQLDPAEFREQIGYVPQDILLFRGTLRENLLMSAPDATDEEILKAAQISGVSDFVQRHPMGFDMPISERGLGLSGGQRQAVAIARAILKNPSTIIMDEPSSEMDNRSEEILKQQLSRWLDKKTFILVTHRASLLDLVDRIIVMDFGHILLDGPKKEVLRRLQQADVRGNK
jgi:ATP-binding cassette subfamily C protein LapB